MRIFSFRRAAPLAAAWLFALCAAQRVEADTVLAGWDLFQTDPTQTNFMGVDFGGVPLGTMGSPAFTFPATNPEGNPINPRNPNLGPTDTIIERMSNVTAAALGSGTTPIQIQALQLETTAAVPAGTFGPGTPAGNYFITLTPKVAQQMGSMTINFGATPAAGGTFSSTLPVTFDVHQGALNGPVVPGLSDQTLTLTSSNTAWSHVPTPLTIQITNVNSILNTTDHSKDFFVGGEVTEKHPTQGQHTAFEAGSVPEPSTIVTGGLGLICGAILILRSSRKRAA